MLTPLPIPIRQLADKPNHVDGTALIVGAPINRDKIR